VSLHDAGSFSANPANLSNRFFRLMDTGILFDNPIKELENAEKAMSAKLPGRARVCCRRAAAQAITLYCLTHQVNLPAETVLDKIRTFRTYPELAPGIHTTLDHLLLRVNSDFEIPGGIDLLHETRCLVDFLLEKKE
jgi:hypothetical protein